MNIIEINDLTFKYKNKLIFDNLNLSIKEGTFLTVSGSSGCGKTTLVKLLVGLLKSNDNIKINNIVMNEESKNNIRKEVAIVFENPENSLLEDTVTENIITPLENLKISKKEINNRLKEISELLNIESLLDLSTYSLSGGEKQLVSIAIALALKPKILILDEFASMLDGVEKEKIFKLLKKINKDQKITIINFTSNIEESLYGKELCLINEGKIILNEKINKAFDNEKIFKKCNLELPFIVSLCNKLKYYNLVDKTIFNMDKLVEQLWK